MELQNAKLEVAAYGLGRYELSPSPLALGLVAAASVVFLPPPAAGNGMVIPRHLACSRLGLA